MATFSTGQAFASGFKIIARNPLAILVWALISLVVAFAPQALMAAAIWPQLQAMTAQQGADAAQSDAALEQMLAFSSRFSAFQLIQFAGSLAASTLLTGAIFRAVLEPGDKAWFYLRASRQELWLGVCIVTMWVVGFMLIFVAMIPIFIVTAILAGASAATGAEPGVGAALAMLAMLLLTTAAAIWLFLRFSLGLPMSFADSYFRLFDSWRLTAGQAGKMALVGIALSVIVFILQMVLLAVVLFAGYGLMGWEGAPDFSTLTLARAAPAIAIGAAVFALFSVVVTVLFSAPLADIHRQLAPTADEPGAPGI
ncbi:hypothetical protein [Phenylobacterium sp.]|uniref:hypothetical protein n=1 Tax=Phenylobacterium sp. TaxID=1871053 RepID=UPI00289FD7F7|nr:hypothetical protein [Phenylobacterium sp.]